MRSILITGASGFIGSQLAELLFEQGDAVTGIDIIDNTSSSNINFIRMGYGDRELFDILRDNEIDTILHLGGISSTNLSWKNPSMTYETNVLQTFNLVDTLIKYRKYIDKLDTILASTIEVYGPSSVHYEFEETDCTNPQSPYSLSKAMAEQLWRLHLTKNGINNSILRFTNTYGRKSSTIFFIENLINCIKNKNHFTVKTPEHVRNFLHVDDHLSMYINFLKNYKTGIYNVTGSETVKIGDLAKIIVDKLYQKQFISEDEINSLLTLDKSDTNLYFLASNQKTMNSIQWKPKIHLKDGIDRLIQ